MFFGQLLAKFRSQPARKNKNKRAAIQRGASTTKNKPGLTSLKTNEALNTNKKLNKALNDIDSAIQSKGPSNQLLLQKAEILLKKGKLRQAKLILNELSKIKNDSKTSDTARLLLTRTQQLQQKAASDSSRELIEKLNQTTKNYFNESPLSFAKENTPSDQELIQLVRKEARRARSRDFPKLSRDLIDQALLAGLESPWLLHDKALSINMMGQQSQALIILKELNAQHEGEKLRNAIKENIEDIEKRAKHYQLRAKFYLVKQSRLSAKKNELNLQFIPETNQVSQKAKIKALIFKEARSCLNQHPEACLGLTNTLLDYFPNDLAALLLKGEALDALHHREEAITIWKELARSKNEKMALKASELIAETLLQKTKSISENKSPKAAILFFIREHLKYQLNPTLNDGVREILKQLESMDTESTDPELQSHQLQLQFNTLLIECFERQRRNQGRLDPSSTAQKPGSIRKTAPKAG